MSEQETTSALPVLEAPKRPEWTRRSPRHRPKGPERILYVDAVKGVAMVLVVLGHLLRSGTEYLSPEADDLMSSLIYAFHMPLFFFITGYCRFLSERKGLMDRRQLGRQAWKLTARLLSAYLLWTALYYLIRILVNDPGDPLTWLTMTLTFRGVAPLWFLGDLLLSELVFLVLQWAFRGEWQRHALAALVLAALCPPTGALLWEANELKKAVTALESAEAALTGVRAPYDVAAHLLPYLQITVGRVIFTLFFLFCGYLAAKLASLRRLPAPDHLLLGTAGLLLMAVVHLRFGGEINLHLCILERPLVFLATGLAGSFGALELCRGLCALLPLWGLRWLGRNSLGIMVLHYPPLPTMELALRWCLLLSPALCQLPLLAAQAALTLCVCALCTFLLQRRLFL